MKLNLLLLICLSLCSCDPVPSFGPREVDWKEEWNTNSDKLKALSKEILSNSNRTYKPGNNEFPKGFSYPFDEGFHIAYSKNDSIIDAASISVKFYIDRGLLDHYSAFIFTNDSFDIRKMDLKIKDSTNDFKLEPNWYMIND
jgi:hypothetical protein